MSEDFLFTFYVGSLFPFSAVNAINVIVEEVALGVPGGTTSIHILFLRKVQG